MGDPVKNWQAFGKVPLTIKLLGGVGLVLPILPVLSIPVLDAMGELPTGEIVDTRDLLIFASLIAGIILIPPSIYLLRGYRWALWFFRGIFGLMILISLAGISSFGLFSLPFGFVCLFLLQKNKLYFQK